MSCGFIPSPTDSEPCGSKSTSSTLRPYSASDAPRLIVVVVLPTPPFWLHIEMIRALPWMPIGRGSGRSGHGRPVGPSTAPSGSTAAAARRIGELTRLRARGTGWAAAVLDGVVTGRGGRCRHAAPRGGISVALEPGIRSRRLVHGALALVGRSDGSNRPRDRAPAPAGAPCDLSTISESVRSAASRPARRRPSSLSRIT